MAKVPELRRLSPEDVDLTSQEGQSKLFTAFNYFAEQTQLALTGNLTLGDNVTALVQQVSFRTAPDYVLNRTFTPLTLNWTKLTRPVAVLVGQVSPLTYTAVQAVWDQTSAFQLKLRYLTGLADSTDYNVTLIVL